MHYTRKSSTILKAEKFQLTFFHGLYTAFKMLTMFLEFPNKIKKLTKNCAERKEEQDVFKTPEKTTVLL